jgi:hypothetical protein
MTKLVTATSDRRFFSVVAILITVLVFTGFARTYYFHALFHVQAPSPFLEIHGAVMSGWIALFLAQTILIKIRRVTWHKRLGVAGVAYAAVMVPIACFATLGAARREVRAHSLLVPSQLNVLGLELTQVLLFASFVAAAVWLRSRTDFHKRLMLVATLCILPNAIVRLALLTHVKYLATNLVLLSLWTLLVVSIVAIDSLRNRRVHRAFAGGASVAIAALYLAWLGSRTAAWDHYWMGVLG